MIFKITEYNQLKTFCFVDDDGIDLYGDEVIAELCDPDDLPVPEDSYDSEQNAYVVSMRDYLNVFDALQYYLNDKDIKGTLKSVDVKGITKRSIKF